MSKDWGWGWVGNEIPSVEWWMEWICRLGFWSARIWMKAGLGWVSVRMMVFGGGSRVLIMITLLKGFLEKGDGDGEGL